MPRTLLNITTGWCFREYDSTGWGQPVNLYGIGLTIARAFINTGAKVYFTGSGLNTLSCAVQSPANGAKEGCGATGASRDIDAGLTRLDAVFRWASLIKVVSETQSRP
jgi:NAD(P)-dependent dehydrogenase (short-subunit alcohol dehydrogenase family)